ncbi:MAG: tetratricopeptide repeat protein [Oceanipulchritudo sp.]
MSLCNAFRLLAILGLLLATAGCRSTDPGTSPDSGNSQTLLEEKLLEVIAEERRLDEAAALPDADEREIQRGFHRLAREYQGIIARNPDHLESHLLYGKLLSRYGDREGAREQFLIAARIDPDIAVIHQQLSTYYAEESDYTRALAYALNAIEIEPETAAYHFGLGQLLVAFRDEYIDEGVFSRSQIETQMLEAFETAASLEPDTLPLQFRHGEAFYDLSSPDWEGALSHWESLQSHPLLTDLQADVVRVHRVRCLRELGRTAEAEEVIASIQRPSLREEGKRLLDGHSGDGPEEADAPASSDS